MVDAVHHWAVQMAYLVFEPFFVDGAKLLQKDDRILFDLIFPGKDLDVGRKLRLVHSRRDRSADDRRAVPVSNIVLDDQHRAHPALLRTDDRAEIGIINIASSDIHSIHTPNKF